MEFAGNEVSRSRSEFTWVVNQVAADSYADTVWVCFLRAIIHNNTGIGDGAIFWDGLDFILG